MMPLCHTLLNAEEMSNAMAMGLLPGTCELYQELRLENELPLPD